MSVWMGARDRSREAVVKTLLGEGLNVRLLEVDVTDESSVHRPADKVALEAGACTFS